MQAHRRAKVSTFSRGLTVLFWLVALPLLLSLYGMNLSALTIALITLTLLAAVAITLRPWRGRR
ncbi:MAG: hypothetical protein QOG33_1777 [Gaiellales bacterium]|nr:hypothetical protein [Gaiellales bacterium]